MPAPVDGAHIRAAILDLASKNISVSEVLVRWNVKSRRLPAPFRGRCRLPKISTLGWDRTAAEMAMAITGLPDRGNSTC